MSLIIATLWCGFFVYWYINICGLFNAKSILVDEQQGCYLIHSWEDSGVHIFLKGNNPKLNVSPPLDFELVYFEFAVLLLTHDAIGPPSV